VDLAVIYQWITEQGTLFWAASGSVALGATLILAAAVAQVRILKARRIAGKTLTQTEEPEVRAQPDFSAEPETVTATAPSAGDSLTRATPETTEPDAQEWRHLLRRLRSANDSLEDFRRRNGPNPHPASESPLKETLGEVEYVFRAGIG